MIKPRLELRPKPLLRLRLAPQIRQTLALLPLSNIELASLIRKELGENPLLEEKEENPGAEEIEAPREKEKEAGIDWIEYLEDYERGVYPTQERREPFPLEKLIAKKPTLSEHLLRQLRLSTPLEAALPKARLRPPWGDLPLTGSTSDRMVLKIGEQIIGNLDRNGYLKIPLNEIAFALKVKEKEVAKVLGLIQTFDPIGVGARDIKECLLIQIKYRRLNPVRGRSPQGGRSRAFGRAASNGVKKPLVSKIIKGYLEDLGKRRYEKIAKSLGVRVKEVQEAADFISTLEPKPGRSFGEESAQTVIPDIILTKVGKEYAIVLNNEGLPRLQISPLYKKMLAKGLHPRGGLSPSQRLSEPEAAPEGSRIKKEERKYIRDRLNAAIGLIKAIDQREKTIYRITESIIKVQRDFLDKGIDYLRPLTLKKIARMIRMHESTVSRATSNKYIQTPQGVFELKYFFAGGFGKSSVRPPKAVGRREETTSSRSIKEAIRDLIDSEDSKKPLSDQKIANILTINLGINIARRTVAKYREKMRILPSHQRRRY